MVNKYLEELNNEKDVLKKSNPFNNLKSSKKKSKKDPSRTPHYPSGNKSSNYFHLILNSNYEKVELDIRGLRYVKVIDDEGKEDVVLERAADHYLSPEGAEKILSKLNGHLTPDIKLGQLTHEEFLQSQEIIRKSFYRYIRNNLYPLGMDTESKQRNASSLFNMILLLIRSSYSRSIKGVENERSHGDISLSGGLDMDRADKFNVEDIKN